MDPEHKMMILLMKTPLSRLSAGTMKQTRMKTKRTGLAGSMSTKVKIWIGMFMT